MQKGKEIGDFQKIKVRYTQKGSHFGENVRKKGHFQGNVRKKSQVDTRRKPPFIPPIYTPYILTIPATITQLASARVSPKWEFSWAGDCSAFLLKIFGN